MSCIVDCQDSAAMSEGFIDEVRANASARACVSIYHIERLYKPRSG